jgi:ELWxxDGT repeat protein
MERQEFPYRRSDVPDAIRSRSRAVAGRRSRPREALQARLLGARLSLTTAALYGLALSVALIGIAAGPGSARAATVTAALVKDINPAGSGAPDSLIASAGTLFFVADGDFTGGELWKSDGTAAGTEMVKDIYPHVDDDYAYRPDWLTDVGGTLFFSADDSTHGRELWKSDGTEGGTMMVKDFDPDPESGPQWLAEVGGTLFFILEETELWKSDGTEAGTVMVKDISPGSESASVGGSLTDVGGTLFFAADDGTHGRELWTSDGTAAGTVMVKDINPDGFGVSWLTNVDNTLFFSGTDGTHGLELWKSDGTEAGTVMVKDIDPSSSGIGPGSLTALDGMLFFSADDGTHGREPWKSDGTAAGTVMVKDIHPGAASALSVSPFTTAGGTLFFGAADGIHGLEPWTSDGTEAGTTMVKNIDPCGSSYPYAFTDVDGTLFFGADDGTHGHELWRTSPMSLPSGRDQSCTTLQVRKRVHRLIARGRVSPNHSDERVIVTLQKKRNGTFVKIARKRPTLGARSRYRAFFERPAAGRCRIVARFPGDEDHRPSSARRNFRC